MSSTDDSRNTDAAQKVIARLQKERRRFRRVHVAVTGRLYIPATQEEAFQFTAVAASLSGAKGVYRGQTGTAWVYMTFGEVRQSRPGN